MTGAKKKAPVDKRVFDLRVTLEGASKRWRLIAVSGDATLPEFYRTIQGAFEVRQALRAHDLTIAGTRYHGGKGSRTRLRSVIAIGDCIACHDVVDGCDALVDVVRSYEVPSRRHHPKVLAGVNAANAAWGSDDELRFATWDAQDAARYGHTSDVDAVPSAPGMMSESEARGLFAAIVSGPMVMPSEWMPLILGDHVWENAIAMQSGIARIMNAYNSVAIDLQEGKLLAFSDAPRWCDGYLRGISLRTSEWRMVANHERLGMALRVMVAVAGHDPEDMLAQALRADPEMYAKTIETLAPAVADIYTFGRSRESRKALLPTTPGVPVRYSTPKISPNDPCPCGSGRKYKRCCSPVRSVG